MARALRSGLDDSTDTRGVAAGADAATKGSEADALALDAVTKLNGILEILGTALLAAFAAALDAVDPVAGASGDVVVGGAPELDASGVDRGSTDCASFLATFGCISLDEASKDAAKKPHQYNKKPSKELGHALESK